MTQLHIEKPKTFWPALGSVVGMIAGGVLYANGVEWLGGGLAGGSLLAFLLCFDEHNTYDTDRARQQGTFRW